MFKKVLTVLLMSVSIAIGSIQPEDIEFKPVKETFNKSEKVCFYIVNKTGDVLYLPSSAPWVVFEDKKFDKIVYSPVALQSIIRLEPSQKKEWCWKQKDFNDEQVPSGEYTIRLTVFKDGERLFLTSLVKIKNSQ